MGSKYIAKEAIIKPIAGQNTQKLAAEFTPTTSPVFSAITPCTLEIPRYGDHLTDKRGMIN